MSTASHEHRNRSLSRSRLIVIGGVLLGVLVLGSTILVWAYMVKEGHPLQSTSSTSGSRAQLQPSPVSTSSDAGVAFNPGRHSSSTLTPTLKRPATTPGANSGSGAPSGPPSPITSFSFTAAGDYGQSNYTTANLTYIGRSGASFNLALGDFSYDPTVSADTWSSYAKSLLPANFPFEIVPGDHDTSQMNTYAADLPDHIGNVSGTYGTEYSFDYPPNAPLARFIMISPGVVSNYNYTQGGADYNWVSQKIDNARAANIRWVIVGMAEGCLFSNSPGYQPCGQPDLLNLLVSKKVDLILQAHLHNYEASKQLALNSTTCPTISLTSYNAQCVVNATTSLTKGAGSVIVNIGTGGRTLLAIDSTDPKTGYFRTWMRPYVNPSFGVSQFTISATKISMKFVAALGGTFTDSFTIA